MNREDFLNQVNNSLHKNFRNLAEAHEDEEFLRQYKNSSTYHFGNQIIKTSYYKHKEEVFNEFVDDSFDNLISVLTSLEPYTTGLHVRLSDDIPEDLDGNYGRRKDVSTETYGTHTILNGVEVNVYSTGSLIHEIGHSIDGTHIADTFNRFSDEDAFGDVLNQYTSIYNTVIDEFKKEHPDQDVDYDGAEKYFLKPTEVFARTFQVWYNSRFPNNEWTINTSHGIGERVAQTCDIDLLDRYYCETLSELNMTAIIDMDLETSLSELHNDEKRL